MGRRPGFYERRIFPWLNDKLTAAPELLQMRAEALASARGRVVNVIACGCNLNRPIAALIESRGFRFDTLRRFYAASIPRTHGYINLGAAVKI